MVFAFAKLRNFSDLNRQAPHKILYDMQWRNYYIFMIITSKKHESLRLCHFKK